MIKLKGFLNTVVLIGFLLLSTLGSPLNGQDLKVDLDYYLPPATYNPKITTPEEFLGYQIGEWHVSHDKLLAYVQLLAKESDRVSITTYAKSYEERPLVYLTIASQKNRNKLEEIKNDYQLISEAKFDESKSVADLPGIVYQGYSIHGNESSGANASLLVAYYLAAGTNDHINRVLDDLIILIDPCMNPDGFQRFSTWVNAHKYTNLISDPSSREYNEPWPKGRTNHYWFDLNRDWLLLVHPESKGRIKTFHEWHPLVLTDHHEMGTNSTFFFQPGVPSRTNPLTPQINQDLTEQIGTYHAAALDSIGSEYFSKERFDDFYYGKGSTYPDVHGCVGILFEQASARGHYQESNNGILTFPFTIRNQVVTSLSTQKASYVNRQELLEYKLEYYKKVLAEAKEKESWSYQVWDSDKEKMNLMLSTLSQHQIKTYASNLPGYYSIDIPLNQAQHRLIKSMFEKVTEFQDSVFYDVSTWHFPSAFDRQYKLNKNFKIDNALLIDQLEYSQVDLSISNKSNIYFRWEQYNAPALLEDLLSENIQVHTGSIQLEEEWKDVIFVKSSNDQIEKLESLAQEWKVELGSAKKLTKRISDNPLEPQNIAMFVGEKINAYDAGHNWFQCDHEWDIPIIMIDKRQIQTANLKKYQVIILPHGRYGDVDYLMPKLEKWVDNGGTLICLKSAIVHAVNKKWIDLPTKKSSAMIEAEKSEIQDDSHQLPGSVLGGSIYEVIPDKDHPLSFGYDENNLCVFKKGTLFFELPKNEKAIAFQFTDDPRTSGYSNDEHIERASNSAAVVSFAKGDGKIIVLTDNPNFRGYWKAGSKLFANAMFLSQEISDNQLVR